jgi:hypothetical protein
MLKYYLDMIMPMANPNYVCSICSQTFTRKWRGTVHNDNIHGGLAKVVRLIDYIVGRSEGEYVSSDPSLYRRRKRAGDPIDHKRPLLDKKLEQPGYFHSSSLRTPQATNQQQNYGSDSKPVQDLLQLFNEGIIKAAELKKLLSKHLSPGELQEMLIKLSIRCAVAGNHLPLDQALEEAYKNVRLMEAYDIVKPQ